MNRICKALAVAVAALLVLPAASQDMPMGPAEIQKLKIWDGTWTGTATGQFGDVKMTMKNGLAEGGMFYKSESINEMMGMTMTETVFFAWDADRGEYVSHGYASISAQVRTEYGSFDGDKYVSLSEPWMVMGQSYESRSTMHRSGDTITFIMEFKTGDTWTEAMKGTFKKAA